MTTLRTAAQQALEALQTVFMPFHPAVIDLKAALEQPEQATGKEPSQVEQTEPTVKESLMVPQHIAEQLTTTDLAWLETRRLVRVWKELGQMRWIGADEGWDKAIEAVRARLDKECQDVLAWKEKADVSGEAAKQVLQRMRGLKDE